MSKKTFEELFAELQQKAATGDPTTSRTAELVQAGVHTIGKKVVEEAAEVWMAAEYESDEAAAEEISQLLYHLQVMMVAKGISSTTSTPTSDPPHRTPTPFTCKGTCSHAAHRCPQQGFTVRACVGDAP